MKIFKKDKILIEGKRSENGLWKIPLNKPTDSKDGETKNHTAYGIIRQDKTKKELAHFYAATLFHPVKSTLLRAIKNNHFSSWPQLNAKLITKHLDKNAPMLQGHLDQEFKKLRSTQPKDEIEDDVAPQQEKDNAKTHDILCSVIATESISKSYSDQTGKFPITSSRGHKYIFVFYHFDTNTILGFPLKVGMQTIYVRHGPQHIKYCKNMAKHQIYIF